MTKDQLRTLVQRALAHDEDAWRDLYQAYVGLVRHVLMRLTHYVSPEDLLDLQAEVWRRAFQGLPKLRCLEAFPAWLVKIADHVASGYRRPRATIDDTGDGTGPPDVSDPDRSIEDRLSDRGQVATLLAKISPDQRQLVLLRYLGGYTAGHIARQLGISEEAVRKRLSRAMSALRHQNNKEK